MTSVLQVSQTSKNRKQHARKRYINVGQELAGVRDIAWGTWRWNSLRRVAKQPLQEHCLPTRHSVQVLRSWSVEESPMSARAISLSFTFPFQSLVIRWLLYRSLEEWAITSVLVGSSPRMKVSWCFFCALSYERPDRDSLLNFFHYGAGVIALAAK